jgi:hypothetical protein
MTAPRTLLAPVILWATLGLNPASAQTCTQWVDYPMTIDYHTPMSLAITEVNVASGHARFRAWRAVDAAMMSDLSASLATGCPQEVRGFTSQTRLFTAGYCGVDYSGTSYLYGYRPTTGRQWTISWWNEEDALSRFGGEVTHTYTHENLAPVNIARKARIGDEVSVVASVNLKAICYGNPDSIADVGQVSYDWVADPVPVVRIWLP